MSDDPLFQRIRDEWQPDRIDAAAFSARLRSRVRRRVATAAALAAAPIVAWLAWPDPAPERVVLEVEHVAAPSTPLPARAIEGIATAADGTPLVGAMVNAGSESTVTDERGRFVISALPGQTVSVTAAGWSTAWARVTDDRPLTITALPSASLGVVSAISGGTLVGPDGFTLTLPPNAVEWPSGQAYTGEVHVRWTLLRRPEDMAAAPGALATVVDGAEVPLESFGMAEVVLTDAEGGRLVLAAPAEIRIPLADAHPFSEGADVGLYSFDEIAGLWSDEGRGIVQDGKMVARVGHFSWWNADAPLFDTGCVCGTVRFDGDRGLMTVHAVGEGWLGRGSTLASSDDGSYCVDVKPSAPVHVEVRSPRGDHCLIGRSGSVVASEAGTSAQIDGAQCARADLDVVSGPCPTAPPVAESAPREERRRLREESIQERRDKLSDRQEPVRVRLEWDGRREDGADVSAMLNWRCGDAAWHEHNPGMFGFMSLPLSDGARCEVEAGGEPFAFVAKEGLRVRCAYGEPCRIVEDERPKTTTIVSIPDTVRLSFEWDLSTAPADAQRASLVCKDGHDEQSADDVGEIVVTVPHGTFCELRAADQSIGFDVIEDTGMKCAYGAPCRPSGQAEEEDVPLPRPKIYRQSPY